MFWDKRISQEVEGEVLGPEFKGYIFKITGGNDKQGFPMMQGVLLNNRTRLLLKKGTFPQQTARVRRSTDIFKFICRIQVLQTS